MRLTDLRDQRVRTLDGDVVGRVHEVHCDNGKIVALMCGPAGFIERWTSKTKGRRVAWDKVVKLGKDGLVIAPDAPSGARARRGTRRTSAPRSKR